jgi:hypothetical protein
MQQNPFSRHLSSIFDHLSGERGAVIRPENLAPRHFQGPRRQ